MSIIKLPINTKPYLRSYTHTAYMSSILTSDLIGGNMVAKYRIHTPKSFGSLNARCTGGETVIDKDTITVTAQKFSNKVRSVVILDVENIEDIIVEIKSIRRGSAWDSVGIILDDEIDTRPLDAGNWLVQYSSPVGSQLFVKRRNDFIQKEDFKRIMDDRFFLRIVRENMKLIFMYSLNGKKWSVLYKDVLPDIYRLLPVKTGIMVDSECAYNDWMTQNYTNFYLAKNDFNPLLLEYYSGPLKHYKSFCTNQFLNIGFEFCDAEKLSAVSFYKKIKNWILEKKYIVTDVDHYYVCGSETYKKYHYFHEVLIYGMDTLTGKCYIMAFGINSSVFNGTINVLDLWGSVNKASFRCIILQADPNMRNMVFKPNIVKAKLQEYLSGIDVDQTHSELSCGNESTKNGIKALEYVVENDDELFSFCIDNRPSFVLYEHSMIMKDRVIYMIQNGYIHPDDSDDMIKQFVVISQKCEIIKNKILMNLSSKGKKTNRETIKEYLEDIIDKQKNAYNQLIQCL